MKSSSFNLDSITSINNRAIGHCYNTNNKIPVKFSAIGAGGLYTSIGDMSPFLRSAINGFPEILTPDIFDEFIAISNPTEENGYALGVVVNASSYCSPFYNHSGNGFGFTSFVGWLPEHSFGFAILCNRESSYAGLQQVQQQIIEHYLPKTKLSIDCLSIEMYPSSIGEKDLPYFESISGEYSNGSTQLSFQVHENTFGIIAPDDDSFHQIHFKSRNYWLFEDDGEIHQFSLNGKYLTNQNNGMTFLKIDHQPQGIAPMDPKWKKYAGRYRSYAYGALESIESLEWIDGNLHLNGNILHEYLPGLFFDQFEQIVDLRNTNVQIEYGEYLKVE